MGATARLIVEMTPAERTALDERAHRAGLSTAEFVRRRINDNDLEEHRAEIEAFLEALEANGPSILLKLDATISAVEATIASIEGLDASRPQTARASE